MIQEHSQFTTEVDEIIADITAVWDELNDRSAELEQLLTCGDDNDMFDKSINMISERVSNIETVLAVEKVPCDLTTAKCYLDERMVCTHLCC